MLKINREYMSGGGIRVRMTGHAEAQRNERDHDLVCAAASILCYTLSGVLKRYCNNPVSILAPGDATLEGVPRTLCVSDFRAAYEAVMEGFALLSRQYPESVEVGEWS